MQHLINVAHSLAVRLNDLLLRVWIVMLSRRPGQGLVEYGLILVLIMVVCVAILGMVGKTISASWYSKLINNSAF